MLHNLHYSNYLYHQQVAMAGCVTLNKDFIKLSSLVSKMSMSAGPFLASGGIRSSKRKGQYAQKEGLFIQTIAIRIV